MPRPRTVSKILWHFTGGPVWDDALNKQDKELKSDEKAYDSLTAILSSKELRVGKYKEIVKVVMPKKRRYNAEKKYFNEIINHAVTAPWIS